MRTDAEVTPNVKQVVPLFMVTDIEVSLRFYVDGLGFEATNEWRPPRADGRIQWCWLQLGDAALMLQEYWRQAPQSKVGVGVSIYFICRDALDLYRTLVARGIDAKRPLVGNRMWVTSVTDPDGYELHFESPTDVAEETEYAE